MMLAHEHFFGDMNQGQFAEKYAEDEYFPLLIKMPLSVAISDGAEDISPPSQELIGLN